MDIEYRLLRYSSQPDDTLGAIFRMADVAPAFRCFTLEDERRTVKVSGETRIPPGRYEIKLRLAGKVHEKYLVRFKDWHKGVLHLQDVPDFTWIYLHTGTTDDHTDGCILVGDGIVQNVTSAGKLLYSEDAYKRLYLEIVELLKKHRVFLEVKDFA